MPPDFSRSLDSSCHDQRNGGDLAVPDGRVTPESPTTIALLVAMGWLTQSHGCPGTLEGPTARPGALGKIGTIPCRLPARVAELADAEGLNPSAP